MKKIHYFCLILCTVILAACSTTNATQKRKTGYKKPPVHVEVGAGPNRVIAVYALRFLGTPYYFGGSSPAEGFDCSGLIQYSAKNSLNINMPRTAATQATFGKRIDVSDVQAGDLVFFNTSGQPNSHAGIYLGDTFFVHAPSSNGAVRVDSITNPYWQVRIHAARRIQSNN